MLPGEFVGTEEEYVSGRGTYVDDGRIIATVAGDLHIDSKRRATIIPKEKIPEIKIGSIVYGRVDEVFESKAFVTVEFSEISTKERVVAMPGIIMVSEIKPQYVRSIRDELRVGDIVKGKVIEITPFNIVISFKSKGLGVIKAFCSKCRHRLTLKGNMLECGNCGSRERRTLGFPYGTV
ncbi:MAG: exosome complex RNA-binding protein Csl4 [Candidatus Micrarchaeia archaeon]